MSEPKEQHEPKQPDRVREEPRPIEKWERREETSTDPRRGAATGHRHLPATRAAARERQGIGSEQYKLLFAVRRSVRYHMQRQRFFDRVGTIAVAVSLAFASGTVLVRVSLAVDSKWVLIVASVSALAQALLLTLQPGQKARKHNDLARDFIALEKQVTRRQNQISQDRLDAFTSERLTIESREPPVARILDAMCHNEMLRAYDRGDEERPVSWFQRLTANLRSEYNEPGRRWKALKVWLSRRRHEQNERYVG